MSGFSSTLYTAPLCKVVLVRSSPTCGVKTNCKLQTFCQSVVTDVELSLLNPSSPTPPNPKQLGDLIGDLALKVLTVATSVLHFV